MSLVDASVNHVYFVRIDAHRNPDGTYDHDPLKVCSSSRGVYPLESEFGRYRPAMNDLRIEGLSGGGSLDSQEFTISMAGAHREVIDFLRKNKIADNDLCIHRAQAVRDARGRWTFRGVKPKIIMLGHVSNATVKNGIGTAHCYTASTDLDSVVGAPTHWTGLHQAKFISPDDHGFDKANRYWEDLGIKTSWA